MSWYYYEYGKLVETFIFHYRGIVFGEYPNQIYLAGQNMFY